MEIINLLTIFSIVLEVAVVIFALIIAISHKCIYGWFFALTFFIYVFYDLARTQNWAVSGTIMSLSFLVASISALIAIYLVYKKEN